MYALTSAVMVIAATTLLLIRGLDRATAPAKIVGMHMDMSQGQRVAMPEVGQPLPRVDWTTVEGARISSDSLRGSVVLLDVWASWCGPCKAEMPEFEKLQSRYREQGLRVIGVSIDMSAEEAQSFAREVGANYEIVHKPDIMGEWGLLGLPTTFIIDREGIIRRMVIGFENPESFEQTIRELL